jgi:hypothetical protein
MLREDKTAGRQIPTSCERKLSGSANKICVSKDEQQTRHEDLLLTVYGAQSIKTWLILISV